MLPPIIYHVYQLLTEYMGEKDGADLVFSTTNGEWVTHLAHELKLLGTKIGSNMPSRFLPCATPAATTVVSDWTRKHGMTSTSGSTESNGRLI